MADPFKMNAKYGIARRALQACRSSGGAQPVTDASFGKDILRALGIGLDFLPQLSDIYAQILRVGQIAP
jgi:hypothetical protein